MSGTLVSVLAPSYGHANYLAECLHSALAQTHQALELIVVDDHSPDASFEIASQIQDSRLRLFRNEKNLGSYGTLNEALDRAKGEWIAVLNSDDVWQPHKLEAQIKALSETGCDWCYTLGDLIDAHGKHLPKDQHGDWPRSPRQNLLPYLLSKNQLLASSVMFRRGSVRFEAGLRYTGDWAAALRLAQQSEAACVAEPLTSWRQHSTNSYLRSRRMTQEEIRMRRSILALADHWLSLSEQKDAMLDSMHDCANSLAALYVLEGEMVEARRAAKLAQSFRSTHAALKRRLVANLPYRVAMRKLWPDESASKPEPQKETAPLVDLSVQNVSRQNVGEGDSRA